MTANSWSALLTAVSKHRDRRARFYKPTCLFAVTQLLDEGAIEPDRIEAVAVLARFKVLVEPLFPRSSDRGWLPFWHLMRDKAWICFKGDTRTPRTAFRIGKPRSAKELLSHVEYAAVPETMESHWANVAARNSLRAQIVASLDSDDDVAAQAMGEYLRNRFSGKYWPAGQTDDIEDDVPPNVRHSEDYSRFRAHKRIERNPKLAADAKRIHGMTCAICSLNFEKAYGPVGRGYIEAHHLIPIASRKGAKVELDPRSDFVVLCSNCHRMVHRAGLPHDLVAFRKLHSFPSYTQKGSQS